MTDRFSQLYVEYSIIAVLALAAAHGLAISAPIFNPDDWAHVAINTPRWGWSMFGRWGQDLVYHYGLGSSFSHSAQAVGALLLFLLFPFLILTRSERTLPSLAALFAAGTCYPYWVDALNFSAHVLAFPLALILSAASFSLACNVTDRPRPSSIAWRAIIGGLLFFVALSIYQPLGAFGIIIPLLFAFRISQINYSQLTRLLASAGLTVIIGSILYIAAYKGYFAMGPDIVVEDSRAGFVNLEILGMKLTHLPDLFMTTLVGGELGKSNPLFPALQVLAISALVFMYLLVVIFLCAEKRLVDATRVLCFVPLALLVPVFAPWLAIKVFPWYPPRALVGFNYALAAVILVLLFEMKALYAQGSLRKFAIAQTAILMILWSSAVSAALTSSELWTKQWRVSQRDLALSTAILAAYANRVSMNEGVKPKLVLVGEKQYGDMFQEPAHTASVARSAFSAPWSRNAILQELFPGAVEVELRSPEILHENCDAFPGKNSVHCHNDDIVVCLESITR